METPQWLCQNPYELERACDETMKWSALSALLCCVAVPVLTTGMSSQSPPILKHDSCKTDAMCLNGGLCHVFHSDSLERKAGGISDEYNYCNCRVGYGGQRCESHCPLTCRNGGVCFSKADGVDSGVTVQSDPIHLMSTLYACKCMGHWTGTVCDIPYENCADGSQCFNAGRCLQRNVTIAVSYCECPLNFGGIACQDKVESLDAPAKDFDLTDSLLIYLSLGVVVFVIVTMCLFYMWLGRRHRGTPYSTVKASEDFENETHSTVNENEARWKNVV